MVKHLLILICLVAVACDPKDAVVESKPFPETKNDGFETLSMEDSIEMTRPTWFFWKNPSDMSTVMRMGAGLEMIEKQIMAAMRKNNQATQQREAYLLDTLGPDNKLIWEQLVAEAKQNTADAITLREQIEAEQIKPEPNQNVIEEASRRLSELEVEFNDIEEKRLAIEQQSGRIDFAETVAAFSEQVRLSSLEINQLKLKAQAMQQQMSKLVEFVPQAPKLVLQTTEDGLRIVLSDFAKDAVECSTDTGLIRNVLFDRAKGYLEFTAICKQPDWVQANQLVSYKIILEKIPDSPTLLLSGNMGRCIDNLPSVGQCQGGLATGVVKYQP